MKKIAEFVMPIKFFAAMIFFGLIVLYVASGILNSIIMGEIVEYAIPFVFVLQSMGLSIVIAMLWAFFFSDVVIKKWRFFKRYTLFALSMLVTLVICFFTILAVPTEWAKTWFFVTLVVFTGTTIFFSLNELYYKRTGERYMEILNAYKKNLPQRLKHHSGL